MKRKVVKDENFYTLNKSIPNIRSAAQNSVTKAILNMVEDISEKLMLEDSTTATWDLVKYNSSELNRIKRELVDLITNYLEDYIED